MTAFHGSRRAVLLLLVLLPPACSDGTAPEEPEPDPVQLEVSVERDSLYFTSWLDTARVTTDVRNEFGKSVPATITWTSLDTSIASVRTVSSVGVVTARGRGTADLVAEADDGTTTARDTTAVLIAWGDPERLVVSPEPDSVYAAEVVPMEMAAEDRDGNRVPLPGPPSWSSIHEHRASIDTAGHVLAKEPGVARIVATAGALEDTLAFEVIGTNRSDHSARWSPDGERIFFQHTAVFSDRQLYSMGPTGRDLRWQTDQRVSVRNFLLDTFSEGRRLLFLCLPEQRRALCVQDAASREVDTLDLVVRHEYDRTALSPDGERLAYVRGTSDLHVASLEAQDPTSLGEGRDPAWSPDGAELFFLRGSGVFRVSADLSEDPSLVLEGGFRDIDPAPDGERMAVAVSGGALITVDLESGDTLFATGEGLDAPARPEWAPDGTAIAFTAEEEGGSARTIFLADPEEGTVTELVAGDGHRWSPSSDRIVFERDDDLHVIDRDGSVELLLTLW